MVTPKHRQWLVLVIVLAIGNNIEAENHPTANQSPEWLQWKNKDGGNNHFYALTLRRHRSAFEAELESLSYLGTHLVSIQSEAEERFLFKHFAEQNNANFLWIGLNRKNLQSPFQWYDGQPCKYLNFTEDSNTLPDEDLQKTAGFGLRRTNATSGLFNWTPISIISISDPSQGYLGIIETPLDPEVAILKYRPPGTLALGLSNPGITASRNLLSSLPTTSPENSRLSKDGSTFWLELVDGSRLLGTFPPDTHIPIQIAGQSVLTKITMISAFRHLPDTNRHEFSFADGSKSTVEASAINFPFRTIFGSFSMPMSLIRNGVKVDPDSFSTND
ncbi:MAG TPA: C-type lectin domain-containing protein [Verrucomicrobiales bacterium]|nr:C-type lectin domain-containing protein [Verrucomicrobiales bacterium]